MLLGLLGPCCLDVPRDCFASNNTGNKRDRWSGCGGIYLIYCVARLPLNSAQPRGKNARRARVHHGPQLLHMQRTLSAACSNRKGAARRFCHELRSETAAPTPLLRAITDTALLAV
eukprot:9758855-Alexandrium_andersonii.AAC.1